MTINELKEKADAKKLEVLVLPALEICKAVLPEHRKMIETEEDFEGVFYTDDAEAYARVPGVLID